MLVAPAAQAQFAGEGATDIVRFYGDRAAHIQLVGERFNGKIELAQQGSGFLLDDRFVLTNEHVVPDVANNYRTLTLNVRLGSRKTDPITATVVARDEANDLALLELAAPKAPRPFCPVSALMPPAALPVGSWLYLMGFPLDRNRTVAPGLLGNDDSDRDLFQTDARLTPGYSGAPIFSSKGFLIAVAVSGVTDMLLPDGSTIRVEGINDLIPIAKLANSPVGQWLIQHSTAECWRETNTMPTADQFAWTSAPITPTAVAAAVGAPVGLGGARSEQYSAVVGGGPTASLPPSTVVSRAPAASPISAASPATLPALPESLSIDQTVSQTMNEHRAAVSSRLFQRTFKPERGYLLEQCQIELSSANRETGVQCDVAADRKTATLRFNLTSGPVYDRWRGWLMATVSLSQKREDLLRNRPVVEEKVRRQNVSYKQEDHVLTATTKSYQHPVLAEPGYSIKECSFEALSTNRAGRVNCTIGPDGNEAVLSFSLQSGPVYDRWRGWLEGTMVLRMTRRP